MKQKKDFDSKDSGTTILDLPPTDSVDVFTGGWGQDDGNPFDKWRRKFKNYATYLTYKKLEGR